RLLFLALEALPETRGLFELNARLAGVRFGPRDAEIDLYARAIGLAIEVDGPFHFLDADAYRRGRRKDALPPRHGRLAARALASDVVEHIASMLEAVLENVRHRLDVQGGNPDGDRGARRDPAVVRDDEAMQSIVEEARAADGSRPARETRQDFRRAHL